MSIVTAMIVRCVGFKKTKLSVFVEDWAERLRPQVLYNCRTLLKWRIAEREGGREGNNNSNSNRKEPEDGL